MGKQSSALEQGAQIVSGTPGRVLDHLKRGTLDASGLKVLVLDEMDEMLSMGFAKELNAILELIPGPDKRQTMCFSATVDGDIQRTAEKHMKDPQVVSLSTDAVGAAEISHYVYMVSGSNRTGDLVKILEAEDPDSAIIFCNLRSETERVAAALQQAGFNADWLNGDLPQRDRERIMGRTREGKLRYLVATDVAARGIDISHLTHVINYSFPEATASYVHRTGRTGRAGRTGCAISLVSPRELGHLYYLRLEYKISPIERSLPTEGELKTRQELDRLTLLAQALDSPLSPSNQALAQRLLTHPDAERIVGNLVKTFFGADDSADEQAAAARRSRTNEPIEEAPADSGRQRRTRPAGPRTTRTRRRSKREERGPEEPQATDSKPTDSKPTDSKPTDSKPTERDEAPNPEATPEEVATIFLNVGRKDGVRVGELAKIIREHGDVTRAEVGRIRVRDRYTFVDLPPDKVDAIIDRLRGVEFQGRELDPERAKAVK